MSGSMKIGRPKTHVCVHLVRLIDGRAMSSVIFRGTRQECDILADDEPPGFWVEPASVADQAWVVKSCREWDEFEALADPVPS